MAISPDRFVSWCLAVACSCAALATVANGQAVWSGLTYTFTKEPFADSSLPENQDILTANVALTRGSLAGLYNALLEDEYNQVDYTSPLGTQWATDLNNDPGTTIAATNWAALTFGNWASAYGGNNQLRFNIVDRDAVVRLIGPVPSEDIYLDLQFTAWGGGFGGHGGYFTYLRAEPPAPEPTGDYNGDLVVNAADYTCWRDTLGATVDAPGDGADGDRSGGIDLADYDHWMWRFNNEIPSGTGGRQSLAVPEPAAMALWFAGLWTAALSRRLVCHVFLHHGVTS